MKVDYTEVYRSGDVRHMAKNVASMADYYLREVSIFHRLKSYELFCKVDMLGVTDRLAENPDTIHLADEWLNSTGSMASVTAADEVMAIAAFQNYAAAALLKENYVCHAIGKSKSKLGVDQSEEPVGAKLAARALKEGKIEKVGKHSLPAKVLFEPAYLAVYGFDDGTAKHLKQINDYRNEIHFSAHGRGRITRDERWVRTLRELDKRISELRH